MGGGKSRNSEALAKCTALMMESGSLGEGCSSLFLSKVLSSLVLLGGLAFKVPQIMKIHKNRSATGVSLSQFCLELCISAITVSFNYHLGAPFSTYGESFFILSQNVVLVFQVAHYTKLPQATFWTGAVLYVSFVAFLFSDFARDLRVPAPKCDLDVGLSSCLLAEARFQDCLQFVSTIFVVISRVPQIYSNFATRDVANLAILTWLLNFCGASIRVFTTLRELPDQHVLQFAFFISAVLSGIVVLQILAFGGKKTKAKAKAH